MKEFLFLSAFREEDIVITFSGYVGYAPGRMSLQQSQQST